MTTPRPAGGETQVSIVVVAREGFSQAPLCLSRLIEVTDYPYRLIYVEDAAPKRIGAKLRAMVRNVGGTYISIRHVLKPHSARLLGLREVRTPWVVFMDNDVLVTPGWLTRLVACGERHQAAYVSPMIMLHGTPPTHVHVAGGVNRIVRDRGVARFIEEYHLMNCELPDRIELESGASETTMAEFHTVMVRRAMLEQAGGLNEGCSTAFEHNDLCLSMAAAGGVGWIEKRAVVEFMEDCAATWDDHKRTMLRWNKRWIDESLDAFCTKWRLDPDDPGFAVSLRSLYQRRFKPLQGIFAMAGSLAGPSCSALAARLADSYIENILLARHWRAQPVIEVQRGGDTPLPHGRT